MKYTALLLILVSPLSLAGGWSQGATPTGLDVERGNGFMVYGSFGNAGSCTVSDRVYVSSDHPQYKEIYSAVLTAYSAGKRVQFYITDCGPLVWYAVVSTTFNISGPASMLKVFD